MKYKPVLIRTSIVLAVLLSLLLIVGSGYFFYSYQTIDLDRELEQPSVILDRDGQEVGRFAAEIRRVVDLEEMSPHLINAVIAIEDSRFYDHLGLDPRGIARALWRNFLGRRVLEGGSTITQQLAKNEYFIDSRGAARNYRRKIREAVYAIKLERTFTKDEILERYLNRIYFGHGRFGVESASLYYFGKSAADLDLAEAALLAGIPRGPAIYSLRISPDRANERKNVILARMAELGLITESERQEAAGQTLTAVELQDSIVRGNHFRQRVEREVRKVLGERFPDLEEKEITNLIYNHGLQITTTLSLPMQIAAEQVVQARGESLQATHPNVQGVFVALDHHTGGITALVESIDLRGTYSRATEGRYKLGSSFKGVLYAAALEEGYTASTQVTCEYTEFPLPVGPPYEPIDFGNTYHNRPLSIREALVESCNVVAVKVHQDLGTTGMLEMASRLNPNLGGRNIGAPGELQTPLGPSASVMDLTLAYASLANGGYNVQHYTVQEIRDKDGFVLYEANPQRTWVIDERIAYIITHILQQVRASGPLPFDTAGKTGTSDLPNNVVFTGYTGDTVATAFFGFDIPAQGTRLGNASVVAAPAWREIMGMTYAETRPPDFVRPPGIEDAIVCTVSGQAATPNCPSTYSELYLPGTVPAQPCPIHGGNQVEICTSTWLLANPYCPAHLRRFVSREGVWDPRLECWFHGPGNPGEDMVPPADEENGDTNDEDEDEQETEQD